MPGDWDEVAEQHERGRRPKDKYRDDCGIVAWVLAEGHKKSEGLVDPRFRVYSIGLKRLFLEENAAGLYLLAIEYAHVVKTIAEVVERDYRGW